MRHRSLLILALLSVAALLLGACGDDSDDSADTDTTAAEGGASDEMSLDGVTLVNDGQLTVCSDMPYEPFEFEEDGETKGFDYDVVSAMGDQLDVDVEFVTTPFDGIIPAMASGSPLRSIARYPRAVKKRSAVSVRRYSFVTPFRRISSSTS